MIFVCTKITNIYPIVKLLLWLNTSFDYLGNDTYSIEDGTSFASPHVAALAGLVLSVNGQLTNNQVETIIRNSSVDLGSSGRDDYFGYGRIDAYNALKYTLENYGGTLTQSLTIPANEVWTIQPGVIWKLASNTRIYVNGTFKAEGLLNVPISFINLNPNETWYGFAFYGSSTNQSTLKYCTIEKASIGICTDHAQPRIEACTIRYCGVGIFVISDSPFLKNNTVSQSSIGLYGEFMSTEVWSNKFRQNECYGAVLINCGNVWYDNKCDYNGIDGLEAFQLVTNDYNRENAPDPPNDGNGMRYNNRYGVWADNYSWLHFNGFNSVHSNNTCDLFVDVIPIPDSYISGYNNYYLGPQLPCMNINVFWNTPYSTPPDPVEYNFIGTNYNFNALSDNDLINYADYKRIKGEYSLSVQALKALYDRGLNTPLAMKGAMLWYKVLNDASFNKPNEDVLSTNIIETKNDFYSHMINGISMNVESGRRYRQLAASMKAYSKEYNDAILLIDTLIQNTVNVQEKLQYLFDKFVYELHGKKNRMHAEAAYSEINGLSSISRHALLARWLLGYTVTYDEWDRIFGSNQNSNSLNELLSNKDMSIPALYLYQNYPNPFNPSTKISYYNPEPGYVQLLVIDMLGREVSILVNENKQPGFYSASFNAKNYPSGIYYYRLIAGNTSRTKKMTLVR